MWNITVLIPAFNEEGTITRCIDSILCQHMDALNIVVLDDGSTDRTVDLCRIYSNSRNNIKVLDSRIHIGAQLNLLRGALCVRSDFTLFMSANDVLVEGSLSRLLSHMAANEDCVACYGRSDWIDANGHPAGEPPAHFYVDARSGSWQDRCLSVAARYVWGGVQYALYRTQSLQLAYPH